MSRGIAFSKNKQVKCFSSCSLSATLISLSVTPSCVGANREKNGGNICTHPHQKKMIWAFSVATSVFRDEEKEEKNSPKRRKGGSSPHKTALSLGGEGDPTSTSTPLPPWRSTGNYDNNMFPPQLFSDLFSEHLAFLKSPPDSI